MISSTKYSKKLLTDLCSEKVRLTTSSLRIGNIPLISIILILFYIGFWLEYFSLSPLIVQILIISIIVYKSFVLIKEKYLFINNLSREYNLSVSEIIDTVDIYKEALREKRMRLREKTIEEIVNS